MSRSRYQPNPAYSVNPYQQQPYGAVQPQTQMPGMMPAQHLANMSPSPYGSPQPNMGQSPVQGSLSPGAMWSSTFANGPIIEDLCAPPPPMAYSAASPPMHALPPRMAIGPMHPGAMPQVQNVFGIRQPTPHPFAHPSVHHHQAQGLGMQGIPSARIVGAYPPYAGSQPGMVYAPPPPPPPPQVHVDPSGVLARPRMETGFPTPVAGTQAGNAPGMGQMGSPEMGSNPDGEGMPPLTPVEEALRGFLSPNLSDLGHH